MRRLVAVTLILAACVDPATAPEANTARAVLTAEDLPPVSWGLDRIDQAALPLSGTTYYHPSRGAGVRIYTLGTGVNAVHPELAGRVTFGVDLTGGDGSDCYGHETGVASVAAGSTVGVAPDAEIVNVRMAGCAGNNSVADMTAAVEWVRLNAVLPAVANISWSEPVVPDDPLVAAVEALVASGVTVVVSAGNNAGDACALTPAAAPNVITVAATTATDAVFSGSNYGPCVDLWAPGHGLTTAYFNAYTTSAQGTSYSAPHVSGAAALWLGNHPTDTPAQVRAALLGAAVTLPVGPFVQVPASQPPPFHDASFATVCVDLTCTFTGVESGVWKIGLVAALGVSAVRTFPFAGTYVVRHTVLASAVEVTVVCNNKRCRN